MGLAKKTFDFILGTVSLVAIYTFTIVISVLPLTLAIVLALVIMRYLFTQVLMSKYAYIAIFVITLDFFLGFEISQFILREAFAMLEYAVGLTLDLVSVLRM